MAAEPHGGELVDRVKEFSGDIEELPHIALDRDEYMDLEMIATGAYSPLTGFMGMDDFNRVLDEMRLSDGNPWSIPIVLASDDEPSQDKHILTFEGDVVGSIDVEEVWEYDEDRWAMEVLDTTEQNHPGVRRIRGRGDYLVGGDVELYRESSEEGYERRLSPGEARDKFAYHGWNNIVGFQTRNPPHRAHEYLQKCALETVDGLFLHPLVGSTKPTDVDADIRMKAYELLIQNYHVSDRVILGTLKAPMRYAGPREALFHAVVRQNYGCTHFIIGRDHAGVKDYYGSYEAHELMRNFEDELHIQPIYFDYAFYCHECDGMATKKTCTHGDGVRENPSGTMIRRKARDGGDVSAKIMRPEIWELVKDAFGGREGKDHENKRTPARTGTKGGG